MPPEQPPDPPSFPLWPLPAGLEAAEEVPAEVTAAANNALGEYLFGGVTLAAWCQPGHRVGVYVGTDVERGGRVIFLECPLCDAGETIRAVVVAALHGSCEAASRPLRFERGTR